MNRNRITILFVTLIMFATACSSSKHPVSVRHVRSLNAGHSLQGFYYALPRNVVTVDITILKTESIPGPFAPWADKYLSIEDVIKEPATHYSIAEVNINSFAEPDPGEFYFVEYDVEEAGEIPFSISLSESGLITSINTPFDSQEFYQSMPRENEYGYFGSESTFNHFVEKGLREQIDTIVERVKKDTITMERQTLRRTWVEKTSEIRAREVAEYILNIRDKKFDLMSGFAEIPYEMESIKYMVEKLEKQEKDYLELFTGIKPQSIIRYRYTYTPDKNATGTPQTLFYFSENRGVQEHSAPDAERITMTIERSDITRQMSVFTMNPTGSRKEVQRGIFYRIPEHGHITIEKENSPLADARMLINQFGTITSLPPEDFEIKFYPNTGSIKSVTRIIEAE